jgi:hypothetical protein
MSHRSSWESALVLGLIPALALGLATAAPAGQRKACSATAAAALAACKKSAASDLELADGMCRNTSDKAAEKSCLSKAKSTFQDDMDSCKEQRNARADVCKALGEAPYDPAFDPNDFDPNFASPTHPNPFSPLGIGDTWTYESGTEQDTVTITSKTKLISGVTCLVSHDQVTDSGHPIEQTNDWFAQAKNGDTWYCGEETAQFETFPGDNPQEPELVGIEGAFKAGRNGDLPGILVLANPAVGAVYRQEFSLNNAEDLAQVLSTTYKFGQNADLDKHVPQALADLLCNGDCLVTREFSPLEPDGDERKYYAAGIGDFLEIEVSTGNVTQLVSCNVDSKCDMLPGP